MKVESRDFSRRGGISANVKITEKYEFDFKFWIISVFAIILVIVIFSVAYRMMMRSQGREVQGLLTRYQLDSPEAARERAQNWVSQNLARQDNLTSSEHKKAEEIFTRAFKEWHDIWKEDRLHGRSEGYTRRRQAESWDRHNKEYRDYITARRK